MDLDRAFGDVLGEVPNPFEIAGNADRGDDLAQIHRHRLAPRDGQDRLFLDVALQKVEARIALDGRLGEPGVETDQRIHGVGQHFFGYATHFRDFPAEDFEFLVVSLDDVIGH